jgi:hypothetical protein
MSLLLGCGEIASERGSISKPATHVFVDANTALHYRRPDQIDWCQLVDSSRVVLVAAPILHRELEYQKVHSPSRKIRSRANAYIKWLVKFVRNPEQEVRKATIWRFIPHEPQIDFHACNLSTAIADDHLIASVINYREQIDEPIFVATADIGLEIKLRHRQIAPLILEDELRLPEDPDPQAKELESLKRQLSQQRKPALSLLTNTEEGRYTFADPTVTVIPGVDSLEDVRLLHPKLAVRHTSPPPGEDLLSRMARVGSAFESMFFSPERIERYNRELDEFFEKYEAFYEKRSAWAARKILTVEASLTLSNAGTAPANDVDVIIQFPDDIALTTELNALREPKQPKPPKRPDPTDLLASTVYFDKAYVAALGRQSVFPQVPLPVVQTASVRVDRQAVRLWVKNVKHGFDFKFEPIFFQFSSTDAIRSFSAPYKILAADLPQPVVGEMHFVCA